MSVLAISTELENGTLKRVIGKLEGDLNKIASMLMKMKVMLR